MPDIATLGLKVDADGAIRELRNFDRALDTTAQKSGQLSKSIATGLGLAVIGGAIASMRKVLQETSEAQRVMAQLEAVIKSTGGAAGFTAKQLDEMAGALQRTTTVSDDAVKGAQTALLQFQKLRGDEFKDALQLVTDISARMGGDLTQNALKVGRALEDPVRGMRALASVGVTFTETDRRMIKQLIDGGKEIEARRIVIDRLRESYDGAAKAARDTLPGALEALKNAYGELFEETEENTRANVRLINSFTRLLQKIKEIRDANVARLNPPDPLDYFRKNPAGSQRLMPDGTYLPGASGSTVTVSAKPPSQNEIDARERAEKDAIEARKKAYREYYEEIEENARFARQQEADWADRFRDILIEHARQIIERRKEIADALGLDTVGTKAVQNIADRGGFDNLVDDKILKRFTGHIGDLDEKTKRLVQTFSQAAEYFIVSKVGGGSFGSSLGAATAKGAFSDLAGGFGKTALGTAIFSPFVAGAGAAIGAGFDAFVKDVFGNGAARKRAIEAFNRAWEDYARDIASQRARVQGDSLTAAILDVQQEMAERRRKVEDTFRPGWADKAFADVGRAREAERIRLLEELNRLEAERIQRLKEEDAERKRYAKEDLEVRALRAQGRDREADRLALENRQKQELFEAERAGYDAAYIARLKEVQAMEKTAEQFDKLTDSVRNAPRGFKVESYVNRFATPLPSIGIERFPVNPVNSKSEPQVVNNIFQIGERAILVDGDDPDDVIVTKLVRGLRKAQGRTVGINTKLSEVMDYLN